MPIAETAQSPRDGYFVHKTLGRYKFDYLTSYHVILCTLHSSTFQRIAFMQSLEASGGMILYSQFLFYDSHTKRILYYCTGDEMTRVFWKSIKDKVIRF